MFTLIPEVLTVEELRDIGAGLGAAHYVAGATTAGGAARDVKANQQAATNTRGYEQAATVMRKAFLRNDKLQATLLPASVTRVMFNRYAQGMQYGPHIDSPLMGQMGNLLRSDIAVTLFLSDPDSYEGGELSVTLGDGATLTFKGPAGSAIAYPANTLHHVTPVRKGVRDAAILWVQSLVRDPAKREILADLKRAEQNIYGRDGRSDAFEAVFRSHSNLMRMWAEL